MEPETGSVITTKQYIDQLAPGDIVEINRGTYFFSVDSDYIDCNGWPLNHKYKAAFIDQVKKRCEGSNLEPLPYTKFNLIEKLS